MEDRLTEPGDVMLLYLPLAHNYGRLLHLSAAYIGFTIAFLPDPLRAATELLRVQPTLFPSVPRVYEKIHTAVVDEVRRGDRRATQADRLGARRRSATCRSCGRRSNRCRAGWLSAHKLADRLVYSKVKARLGGRLRVANAGGAPLSREIAEFFHAIDILILEGYGLSEVTTAATVNRPTAFRFGTVGKPLPGVEVRIAEDGEILLRSNTVFAGYYHDAGGDARGARRRRLRAHRRHRPPRRRRLPRDHRPQEGHHRHGRRQERRAAEPRERAEGAQDRLAGGRRRRPQAVHRRADHARPGDRHRRCARARCSARSTR